MIFPKFDSPGFGALLLGAVGIASSSGEVVLDGKFGASGSIAGPNYVIPAEVGALRGPNLFHSLARFNLGKGESAAFTGPSSIQNILARVTGGSPSSINGTIRSEIAGANLFLLNPSGIVFGPGAAVDVTGSFAATTADYLKLADGARFVAALSADDSALSSAPVAAFGFLGSQPANLSINEASLDVTEGKAISLVGGNIALKSGTIRAPAGEVRLAAWPSPGEVALGDTRVPKGGSVTLEKHSSIDASGAGGGRVVIRGGKLTVDNSSIESNTTGSGSGRGIDISMSERVEVLNAAQINSLSPDAFGPGGNIEISAPLVRLDGGGIADDFGEPVTQISASSGNYFSDGAAKGGNVTVRADRLEIVNSSRISSDSFGAGDAGRIEIDAQSLLLDNRGIESVTQISADNLGLRGGKGGDILIRAGSVDVLNGANISSWTIGAAPAGLIDIQTHSLNLLNGSYIGSPTLGQGQAGDIHIRADKLRIDGEGTGIVAFTFPGEAASGGNVQIEADQLELLNGGFVITTSFGGGPGGNINIAARNFRLDNGATVNASGQGQGKAGDIFVRTSGPILLSNGSSIDTSAPESSGGNIRVEAAGGVQLFSSAISALAGLNGGNVSLFSPSLLYLLRSTITAQADATEGGFGNGGNLTLSPSQLVMNQSALISRSSFGNGGNISVLADYFFQAESLIDASAPFGLAGSVQVTAPELDLSNVYLGLPANLLDATTMLRPDCGVRLGGNISSFIVGSRGGMPLIPGGFVPSSGATTDSEE